MNSPYKGPVTRKILPFDDVIMALRMRGWTILPISSNDPTKSPHRTFQAWSMNVALIPVYDILISSQCRHSSGPDLHASNCCLAYTIINTYLLTVLYVCGQRTLGDIKKMCQSAKFYPRKLTMIKLDFKTSTLTTFRHPVHNELMQKANI